MVVRRLRQWRISTVLVCVNTSPPPHPKSPLVDPVELFFMGKGGALYTTGTKAAADILIPYEAL